MSRNLAVSGGTPLFKKNEYQAAIWPPVREATADKIRELYLSRAWSFNSPTEQAFENEFSSYHGAKYGIMMSNGTVTLECALAALGVGPGDEVIVPDLTWIATAMSVRYVGATCVFADIEKTTACLDPAAFERMITPKTKAVIPVHLYGGMADLDKILAIAKKHNIAVIEDCAHMQGGKWNGRGCGSWGAIGSFSFQQSKTLAAGEAGICITSDEKRAERLYRAKHIGYSRYDKQGQAGTPPPQDLVCHNYRGLASQAQIRRDQLSELPDFNRRHNEFRNILEQEIKDIPGVRLQSRGRLASPQGYYALGLIFEGDGFEKIPLLKICQALGEEGIPGVSRSYGRVCKHLLFNMKPEDYRIDPEGCPNSEFLTAHMTQFMHCSMYYPESATKMAAAIRKVAENKAELM